MYKISYLIKLINWLNTWIINRIYGPECCTGGEEEDPKLKPEVKTRLSG
jgi:hypothetical protein